MTTPFSSQKIEEAVRHAFPGVKVHSIVAIPGKCPVRLFRISISHSEKFVNLSIPPSSNIRLFRHESNLVYDEASLLSFLAKAAIPADVKKIVPSLIKHSPTALGLKTPYNIMSSAEGKPFSAISEKLTATERCKVHTQLDGLHREFSTILSPTAKFGRVSEVCAGAGSKTWTEAFMSLLESVLRDGEDMSVNLPYERIRWHAAKWVWALDEVVVPRLVVLDAEDSEKVLLTYGDPNGVRVSGLQNWSQGIFGDPMVLKRFEDPSQEFLKDWQNQHNPEQVDGEGGRKARLLLYACWRAIMEIVTEYIRPQAGSSGRELEARKKLTNSLSSLDSCKIVQGEDSEPRRYSKPNPGQPPEMKLLSEKSLQPCSSVPFVILNSI